jgi:DNA-binding NtrC family response regulator
VARAFEREYLLRALESVGTARRQQAAELLGISRKNLWEKLRAHGVHDGDDT